MATKWPSKTGMGGRINTIMQTCFFAISGVLPREEAIAAIKHAIKKTYGKRGESVVQKNFAAVDAALEPPPSKSRSRPRSPPLFDMRPPVPAAAPEFVQKVTATHHRRRRRRPAGQRHAHRRHLPHRHRAVGEAQHRPRNSRVGRGALHPVRQVRAGLPPQRDPRQGLRRPATSTARPPPSSPCPPAGRT